MMSILVFQFMAPIASAFPSADHSIGHSQKADDRPGDCAMMIEKAIDAPDSSSSHRGHPENAAHCLPSMCCFHETFGSAQIVAIGLLLPSSRLIERGTALSSHPLSTQDRPPRHT
jgi:hypothetical protein